MPQQEAYRLDDLPPRVIKLKVRVEGAHIKARVFIGQDGHPGLCGELVMRAEDWWDFRGALVDGDMARGPAAHFEYSDDAKQFLLGSGGKRPAPQPVMHADVPEEQWRELR